jgi:hypothetical protein
MLLLHVVGVPMLAPELQRRAALTLSAIMRPGKAPTADWWDKFSAVLQSQVTVYFNHLSINLSSGSRIHDML